MQSDQSLKCLNNCTKFLQNLITKSHFQVPLGLVFKNENINDDMTEILRQFHNYLPQTHNGGIDGQLISGDQLSIERAVNVISSVANGYTPKDRLEGLNLQLGDWHAAVKLLSVSKTVIYKERILLPHPPIANTLLIWKIRTCLRTRVSKFSSCAPSL